MRSEFFFFTYFVLLLGVSSILPPSRTICNSLLDLYATGSGLDSSVFNKWLDFGGIVAWFRQLVSSSCTTHPPAIKRPWLQRCRIERVSTNTITHNIYSVHFILNETSNRLDITVPFNPTLGDRIAIFYSMVPWVLSLVWLTMTFVFRTTQLLLGVFWALIVVLLVISNISARSLFCSFARALLLSLCNLCLSIPPSYTDT